MLYEKRKKLIKSEVINLFKTTKETLRYYEKEGLLEPEIDEKKYRYYDIDEMKRLRQIFLFKDLGFSLKQTKEVIKEEISLDDYKILLERQNKVLLDKIEHYKEVQQDIGHVIRLLDHKTFSLSFKEKLLDEKYYYVFNPFDSPLLDSLKAYYDQFKDIIESDFYSEKSLITAFDYQSMDNFRKEDSNMCLEIDQESYNVLRNQKDTKFMIRPKGNYLSIFYVFKDNMFESLDKIKKNIDKYLLDQALELDDFMVLELEHPELSISLEEDLNIYELQVMVKSKS